MEEENRKTKIKVVRLYWEWSGIDWCRQMEEEENRRQIPMGSRRHWLNYKDHMQMKKKKMAGQLLATNYT